MASNNPLHGGTDDSTHNKSPNKCHNELNESIRDQPPTSAQLDQLTKDNPQEGFSVATKSLKNFTAFDKYPWQFDKDFLHGALQMTKGLSKEQALKVLLQARIWWYESKQNGTIDIGEYGVYNILRNQSNSEPKNPDGGILAKLNAIRKHMNESEEKRLAEEAAKVPSWQKFARRANLHLKANQAGAEVRVDGAAGSSTTGANSGREVSPTVSDNERGGAGGEPSGEAGDAPYPEQFKLIAEAVINNKPVPGVKMIPDTVYRPSGITPIGAMRAPLKPWERKKTATASATDPNSRSKMPENVGNIDNPPLLNDVLDKDFPPLEASKEDIRKEEDALMREG